MQPSAGYQVMPSIMVEDTGTIACYNHSSFTDNTSVMISRVSYKEDYGRCDPCYLHLFIPLCENKSLLKNPVLNFVLILTLVD